MMLGARIRDWLRICGKYAFVTYADFAAAHCDSVCFMCGDRMEFGIDNCRLLRYSSTLRSMCSLGFPVSLTAHNDTLSPSHQLYPGYVARMCVSFCYSGTRPLYGDRNFWLRVYSPEIRI